MKSQNRKKSSTRPSRRARAGNGHGRFSLARNLDSLGSSAQSAVRSGRQAVNSAYEMASGLSRSLPSARDMVPRTPRNLQRMVDNNPLLLGVIGIGVGLLLGALMPLGMGGTAQPQRSAPRRPARAKRRAARRRAKSAPARTATASGKTPSGKTPSHAPAGV